MLFIWFTGCEALTIPISSNVDLPPSATVTIEGSDSIPGLGSSITFYLWSLQESTMFFSDDVLSTVEGWHSIDDCDGSPRYQSAKVSVWATFSNEETGLNITADVTTFVHEVSAKFIWTYIQIYVDICVYVYVVPCACVCCV